MNFLILFGSSTGNTEELANTVQATLQNLGHKAELINIAEESDIDYAAYDFLFIGSSTWDEGQPQLDLRFHIEDLEAAKVDLSGKKFAVFGTGESAYEFFCGGIDQVEGKYQQFRAKKAHDSLKIDTLEEDPVDNEKTVEWTKSVVSKMSD